ERVVVALLCVSEVPMRVHRMRVPRRECEPAGAVGLRQLKRSRARMSSGTKARSRTGLDRGGDGLISLQKDGWDLARRRTMTRRIIRWRLYGRSCSCSPAAVSLSG